MTKLSFEVLGQPVPQGSARGFVRGGRAVITSANSKLRPWRDTVMWAARDALANLPRRLTTFPLTGPLELRAMFWVHRPVSAPKTRDVMPVSPPDLDKLIRAIGDSLTNAGVIRDDGLICAVFTLKRYAVGPELAKIYRPDFHWPQPGVEVVIEDFRDPH